MANVCFPSNWEGGTVPWLDRGLCSDRPDAQQQLASGLGADADYARQRALHSFGLQQEMMQNRLGLQAALGGLAAQRIPDFASENLSMTNCWMVPGGAVAIPTRESSIPPSGKPFLLPERGRFRRFLSSFFGFMVRV